MHLMAAERRCFEDLTATLHDGPAMKEGGGRGSSGPKRTPTDARRRRGVEMTVWLFIKRPWFKSCQQVTSPEPFHAL